jgi:hypothetical protein
LCERGGRRKQHYTVTDTLNCQRLSLGPTLIVFGKAPINTVPHNLQAISDLALVIPERNYIFQVLRTSGRGPCVNPIDFFQESWHIGHSFCISKCLNLLTRKIV